MKIMHVIADFPPQRSGTGNVAYHNAVELVRLGHEVHVFAPRIPNAPANEVMNGIHVHRLHPLLRYGNAVFLPSLLTQARGFDVVHLHMPFYGGSEAIAMLHWLGTPLVITHHQDVHLQGITGIISRVHDATFGNVLMSGANRTCFTSLDYGRSSKYAHVIKSKRMHADELSNGVDIHRFTPGERPPYLVERYNLANKKVMLFVGVLDSAHYFKGVHILLQALANLRDVAALQDTVLIVVGKGNMLTTYQQQAETLGIAEQVHFAGFVPDDELPDHYRLADVTVLPSTTSGEAFGLVLVESLATGRPVIASNLAGVRTVVAEGQDGFLVQPGNVLDLETKLAAMFKLSPERRTRMGEHGRRKVEERYAWEKIALRLEHIYREVIA